MFKKLFSVISVILVIFLFASCSKEESIGRGTVTDKKYENKGFGISYTCPDGWRYLSNTEMVSALGLSNGEDMSEEDAKALLETSAAIYDSYCVNEDGSSTINFCYEYNTDNGESIYDTESYLELSKGSIESMVEYYSSMELEKLEISDQEINGKTVECLNVKFYLTESESYFYEKILVMETKGWMASITIGSSAESEEEADEILESIMSNVRF